jgi:cytochrome P450
MAVILPTRQEASCGSAMKPVIRKKQPWPWFAGFDSLAAIKKDSLTYYNRLHAEYGDVVRVQLGPYRCWFLFHPDHVEQVLAKQAVKFIRFERLMNILRQWNGESLLVAEGHSWQERRKKVLPAFKQSRLPEYAGLITRQASGLLELWRSNIKENGSYLSNIDNDMARHALDVAGLTLFGKRLTEKSLEVSEAVHELSEIAFREAIDPFQLPDFLPLPSKAHKRRVVRFMKKTIGDIVGTRLSEPAQDKGDLLSILIEHHDRDQAAIEEDVMSLLIAGHETSGATLSWLFLLLAQHQDVLKLVHKELDEVVGSGSPGYEHLKQLPYLTAVIQETMRLYPPAYALFCRRATSDVDLNGIKIRKGDLVQLLPIVTHRDGRWFESADQFKPDRFLTEPAWPRYAYFPFGAGPRVCIGQSFGMMEMVLTAAVLLKDLALSPTEDDFKMSPRFSLRPAFKYEVEFSERRK